MYQFLSGYTAKVADDQWNKFWVKSRWMDLTAGGGPNFVSWRDNYQWLLTLPRELLRLGLFSHLEYLPKMLDQKITIKMLPTLTEERLEKLGERFDAWIALG